MSARRRAGLALVLGLSLAGSATASAATLRVFAAASLTEAFAEIAAAYEEAHPGDLVELNFAGSQVLRTQIEHGAPADVFASADLAHAEALAGAKRLGPLRVFARNGLVVVVPSGEARVAGLADLARRGTKLVVAGPSVPAGRYTAQVLDRLGAAGLFGGDFSARVQANVVSQETNVRAVLAKVVLGEADAGFVYATDAAAAGPKVRTIEIPDRHNVIAEYPIAIVVRSQEARRAQAFVDLVTGPEGQAILRRRGFAP